jgi:hypothetical protein
MVELWIQMACQRVNEYVKSIDVFENLKFEVSTEIVLIHKILAD